MAHGMAETSSATETGGVTELDGLDLVDPGLMRMVGEHYDSEPLMRLAGEIHFDAELSRAEVAAALRVYGRPLPSLVYLPCCGPLRHAAPLLEAGAERLVCVDLSRGALEAGLARNVPAPFRPRLDVRHGDVRAAARALPPGGAEFAFMGGNSLGDVTDPGGHERFIAALAGALAPGGVLVFDYAGGRYAPDAGDGTTEWPELYRGPDGDVEAVDRRRRTLRPLDGTPMAVLSVACEVVEAATGRTVVPPHTYEKLAVPDDVLAEQFARAGLELTDAGPVAEWSPYHRDRIDRVGDLGMLGEPDHWYRAVRA
ncbi:class I SAM-dependent methyltransferase [Nocardiopsis potens]|uniref:class I SAM-dependent methyltransferase n=1 Tax=Nocardiopsis potens TaxID=1246458 RepID=UPI0003605A6D|nr:class I SAM-dependent methyltransferase [Nocardiopsis potens]